MAKSKPLPNRPVKISSGNYRGCNIDLMQGAKHKYLVIDGLEIHMEQDDDGYLSHQHFIYQKFGTPYELAETLIREWGDLGVKAVQNPKHGGAGHKH